MSKKYVIRKCGLTELYLASNGSWGELKKARRCGSQELAMEFARKNTWESYGLFPA